MQDFIGTLENLRRQYNQTGDALIRLHNDAAREIVSTGAIDKAAARVVGENYGFTQGEINYLLSNPKAIENIDAQTSAIDKTKDKVLELNRAWGKLTDEIGNDTVEAINQIAPAVQPVLNWITSYLENGRLHGAERRAALWQGLKNFGGVVSNALDSSAGSLSTGDLFSKGGTSYPLHTQKLPLGYLNYDLGDDAGRSSNKTVAISINEVTINSPEQVNAEVLLREIQNVVHVPAADHIINYYNDGRIA